MPRTRSIALVVILAMAACVPSAEMKPGVRCGSCHGDHVPGFSVAGTMYADQLAPRDRGLEGARVDITDADGALVTMLSNRAGNFFTHARLTPPLQVTVTKGGVRTSMQNAPHGDCNACHTAGGAPGQIHLP